MFLGMSRPRCGSVAVNSPQLPPGVTGRARRNKAKTARRGKEALTFARLRLCSPQIPSHTLRNEMMVDVDVDGGVPVVVFCTFFPPAKYLHAIVGYGISKPEGRRAEQ